MPAPGLQLEFWIPKGRKGGSWVQASPADTGAPNGKFRTWRKVKPGHKHPDKMSHSLRLMTNYARTRTEQCDAYCKRAAFAGLKSVHTFGGDHISNTAARKFGRYQIEVDVKDFIGPAPADEYDCYGDWDHNGPPQNTGE